MWPPDTSFAGCAILSPDLLCTDISNARIATIKPGSKRDSGLLYDGADRISAVNRPRKGLHREVLVLPAMAERWPSLATR
ncbi:MAG: hypothetical protein WCF20_03920 [Methylovirgula sp.]